MSNFQSNVIITRLYYTSLCRAHAERDVSVILCFQFVSAAATAASAAATAATKTFASHIKTVYAKPKATAGGGIAHI